MSGQHTRHPRATPVVTVFLSAGGKVALFKRSDRVGSYAGAWAGVSGYIERLPLEQAYVELREETALEGDDVELRGIGVPVVVEDTDLNRTWIVHPFLFDRYSPQRITIDWEADSVEWVAPDKLTDRHTVPGLDRALDSVWPAFGDAPFWRGLSEIAIDTVRSATSLALAGIDTLDAYLLRDSSAPRDRAIRAFAACRPSMGIFPHVAATYILNRPGVADLRRDVTEATSASVRNAARALGPYNRILTNSYSISVDEAILLRAKQTGPLEVTVMESRPELEGVGLARDLAKQGVRVSVITDAQAGLFAQMADAVVVGCDAITCDDGLQNKAGTSLLIMAARAYGIPCFAIAQTFKIMPPNFPHSLEEQEPENVGKEDGIRFRNLVFDTTPIEWFDAIYTENGDLTSAQLNSIRKRLSAAKLASMEGS